MVLDFWRFLRWFWKFLLSFDTYGLIFFYFILLFIYNFTGFGFGFALAGIFVKEKAKLALIKASEISQSARHKRLKGVWKVYRLAAKIK